MNIQDIITSKIVAAVPNDTTVLSGVVGLRVANTNASTTWRSLRVRGRDGADVTLSFPPGLTAEFFPVDKVYATSPVPDADLTIHLYIKG